MKKVMITGHRGYIGTVLAPVLRSAGYDVTGLDADWYRDCTFGDLNDSFPWIAKDIRDVTVSDLTGIVAVVHLAGLSNDPLGDLDPELTDVINHQATLSLAAHAKAAGVSRFVFSSSCSNYGAGGSNRMDEESPLHPVTPYARSKVMAEAGLKALAGPNFSPVLLRCATAYGASPRLRFDLVLNNLMAWAYTTGRVVLKSDGTPWRPVVHVADICRAILAVLSAPREAVHNEAFNVGIDSENYRIRDLAQIVCETVTGSHIVTAPGAGPDTRCYRVDCCKIAMHLPAFQPRWDVRLGTRQLLATYRRNQLDREEFEGARYSRIAHLCHLRETGRLNARLRWRRSHLRVPAEVECANEQ